jgi:hypothetical protein
MAAAGEANAALRPTQRVPAACPIARPARSFRPGCQPCIAARIFWGEQLLPISAPLPFYAYPVLVMTFIGWIWSLSRESE